MAFKTLLVDCQNKISTVTLNRPEVKNALSSDLIIELTRLFREDLSTIKPRAVIISGAGSAFCAGADLKMLEKKGDTKSFSDLLLLMDNLPCPLVGKIHGSVMGGGMGLVAVCDIVVASKETQFGFPEAKLGLIPAIIAPYVLAKIGETHARSLILTAERFGSQRACEIGLIHKVAENREDLEALVEALARHILEASPNALTTAKKFLSDLKKLSFPRQQAVAVKTLENLRASKEGKEGIRAFLEKRKPNW